MSPNIRSHPIVFLAGEAGKRGDAALEKLSHAAARAGHASFLVEPGRQSAYLLTGAGQLSRLLNRTVLVPALVSRLEERGLQSRPIVVCQDASPAVIDVLEQLDAALILYRDTGRTAELDVRLRARADALLPAALSFDELASALESAVQKRGYLVPASSTRRRRNSAVRALGKTGLLQLAGAVAGLATFFAAARGLGPADLGRAAVILSAGAALSLAPSLGLPSALRELTLRAGNGRRAALVSTGLAFQLIWAALSLSIIVASSDDLAMRFGLTSAFLEPAILLAYALALVNAARALQPARARLARSLSLSLGGFAAAFALARLSSGGAVSYEMPAEALCWGLCAAFLAALISLLPDLEAELRPFALRGGLAPAARGMLAHGGFALTLSAPLILRGVDDWSTAGVYAAYFVFSAGAALGLGALAREALADIANTPSAQSQARVALRRWIPRLLLGGPPAFVALTAAGLRLLGPGFAFDHQTAALLSVASALILCSDLASVVASAGEGRGGALTASTTLFTGALNAFLVFLLAPSYGVPGAAAALAAAQALRLALMMVIARYA